MTKFIQKGRKVKFPHAFCRELGQKVTPQEAQIQKEKYPNQTLTFLCADCHGELILTKYNNLFPIFKGKKGEIHYTCNPTVNSHPPSLPGLSEKTASSFEEIATQLETLHQSITLLKKTWERL